MTPHRDKECDSIVRYQSSLRSLHRLYQYFKSSHIPRDAFMNVSYFLIVNNGDYINVKVKFERPL